MRSIVIAQICFGLVESTGHCLTLGEFKSKHSGLEIFDSGFAVPLIPRGDFACVKLENHKNLLEESILRNIISDAIGSLYNEGCTKPNGELEIHHILSCSLNERRHKVVADLYQADPSWHFYCREGDNQFGEIHLARKSGSDPSVSAQGYCQRLKPVFDKILNYREIHPHQL